MPLEASWETDLLPFPSLAVCVLVKRPMTHRASISSASVLSSLVLGGLGGWVGGSRELVLTEATVDRNLIQGCPAPSSGGGMGMGGECM